MQNQIKLPKDKLKENLDISIQENDKALDYIQNLMSQTNDRIKFNRTEEDIYVLDRLIYIGYVLKHVCVQYKEVRKGLKD